MVSGLMALNKIIFLQVMLLGNPCMIYVTPILSSNAVGGNITFCLVNDLWPIVNILKNQSRVCPYYNDRKTRSPGKPRTYRPVLNNSHCFSSTLQVVPASILRYDVNQFSVMVTFCHFSLMSNSAIPLIVLIVK